MSSLFQSIKSTNKTFKTQPSFCVYCIFQNSPDKSSFVFSPILILYLSAQKIISTKILSATHKEQWKYTLARWWKKKFMIHLSLLWCVSKFPRVQCFIFSETVHVLKAAAVTSKHYNLSTIFVVSPFWRLRCPLDGG